MIYHFQDDRTQDPNHAPLLGSKGAGLVELYRCGFPTPPGFVISSQACLRYWQQARYISDRLRSELHVAMDCLQQQTNLRFGSLRRPLCVSVRSGAASPLAGVCPTILNVGLNDAVVYRPSLEPTERRMRLDCYRRLIQQFGQFVAGIEEEEWRDLEQCVSDEFSVEWVSQLPVEGLERLCRRAARRFQEYMGCSFPQDPYDQLEQCLVAAFESWESPAATAFRQRHGWPAAEGVAVTIQQMVFGNRDQQSASGVAFSRDPSSGQDVIYGEFLACSQGTEVLRSAYQSQPVANMDRWDPRLLEKLRTMKRELEYRFGDMQDFEFTIEDGTLYVLQSRSGRRRAEAAVKIANDLVKEGIIDEETAAWRVSWEQVNQLRRPVFDSDAKQHACLLAMGVPAAPGVAVGRLAFSPAEANQRAEEGEAVILLWEDGHHIEMEDMLIPQAVVARRGGILCQAAINARQLGHGCVTGVERFQIDRPQRRLRVVDLELGPHDAISVDGNTGEILLGVVPRCRPTDSFELREVVNWMKKHGNL